MEDKEDCPQILIKMAHTKWQKQVAITFLELNKTITEVQNEVKHLKWLVLGVFGAIFFNIIIGMLI